MPHHPYGTQKSLIHYSKTLKAAGRTTTRCTDTVCQKFGLFRYYAHDWRFMNLTSSYGSQCVEMGPYSGKHHWQIGKLQLCLSEFEFSVVHRDGTKNHSPEELLRLGTGGTKILEFDYDIQDMMVLLGQHRGGKINDDQKGYTDLLFTCEQCDGSIGMVKAHNWGWLSSPTLQRLMWRRKRFHRGKSFIKQRLNILNTKQSSELLDFPFQYLRTNIMVFCFNEHQSMGICRSTCQSQFRQNIISLYLTLADSQETKYVRHFERCFLTTYCKTITYDSEGLQLLRTGWI